MKVKKIVSLMNHQVRIHLKSGETVVLHPSGNRARRDESVLELGDLECELGNIPAISKRMGGIAGLPEREEGTIYITSLHVASRAWDIGRDDVVTLGNMVRDKDSRRTIACRSLSMSPKIKKFAED